MSSSENVAENPGWTLLNLAVDRSGSMAGIKEDMERAIKSPHRHPTISGIAARPVLSGITFHKANMSMAATPGGTGYPFVASDGCVFRYCDVGFFGSAVGAP